MIPHDSNFILGLEVGDILAKPVVKMRQEKGRIEIDKPWDGNLEGEDNIIIVHDVMVTSGQIVLAMSKLPQTCTNLGVYCLIARKEFGGKGVVEAKGISVNSVIELNDDDIKKIRGNLI